MKKKEKINSKNEILIQEPPSTPKRNFPIVGIGASAGGLAAFEAFFSAMPADQDTGMAFILVQHLDPDHKSILTELIRRYTRMQVFEVEDGMTVQINCVYIIPPNRNMTFLHGTLHLFELASPRGLRLPIDFFFRSLAQDLHERAICIVLSGTGSDGTLGIRAIKGEGGMAMAQNPKSTEYDGMPLNAIATGLVDFILTPAEMPAQLRAYTMQAFSMAPKLVSTLPDRIEVSIKKICVLLRSKTGHDFSLYKQNTMIRRIERRMAVHQITEMDGYIKYLQQDTNEVEALFRDLLIGVTNFFRDPDAFDELQKQILIPLLNDKHAGSLIRVWVPGCSTGEEAYSIAILLCEQMEKLYKNLVIQVFATDIDKYAIKTARAGIYPVSISTDISPERLARYFTLDAESCNYRIHKSIRDMLIFSEQDLIKDPPFSKIDLISCRNLLIYLSADLQKKIIPLFHYALLQGGYLFLGSSETVGEYANLFKALDRKRKLYLHKEDLTSSHRLAIGSYLPPITENGMLNVHAKSDFSSNKINLRELTEQVMLQQFTAVGAMVNERGDILYIHGRTGMFLEPSPGEIGTNILKMAREGLKQDLISALNQAVTRKEMAIRSGLRVRTNSHFTTVNLTVRPVTTNVDNLDTSDGFTSGKLPPGSATLFMIVFEEVSVLRLMNGKAKQNPDNNKTKLSEGADINNSDVDMRIAELTRELQVKDEYLQSTSEELETSNEELKSSNEEMQSVNEELQSTNEELETSKEELQSVNEELSTVNNELQIKLSDLTRLNNDMNNLLSGTGIGTIFVDHGLRILRFTPTVTRIINLIQSDIGRPVSHIVSNLIGYNQLTSDVQEVLDTLIPKEFEVQVQEGAWYILHIMPYRTIDNIIEGSVITFVDITERKQAEDKIKNLLTENELILKEVHHRIKNNMSTIFSLLSLQAGKTNDLAIKTALKDAGSRVQSMIMLYDKLYQSTSFNEISIKRYLPALVDQIVSNFPNSGSVKVEKDIGEFILDSKTLSTLGIIINELLTNIMKYAFTDRDDGIITVSASIKDNYISLIIQDNGNGIPESVDIENSTGFGLQLVSMLTTQLDGTIQIERKNGTRITLKFVI